MTTVFQETEWEENVTAGYIAISFVIWVILDYLDSPFYTYFAWTAFLFYICISGFQDVLRRRKVKVHGTEEYAEQSGYFGTIYMARKDRQKEEKLTVDEILFSACMIMTTVSIWIIVAEWVGDLYGFIAALAVYIVSIWLHDKLYLPTEKERESLVDNTEEGEWRDVWTKFGITYRKKIYHPSLNNPIDSSEE